MLASEDPIELADLLNEASALAQAGRRRGPRGRAGPERGRRHRRVDPRGEGQPGQARPRRRGLPEDRRPERPRDQDARRPRPEPRGPEADLAALALLRRAGRSTTASSVLFKPGAERDSRTLAADDLFERGRSVLTAGGRKQLDDVGAWFTKAKHAKSEVVIAAFTDDGRDPDLAQILTQEQAEAVRNYLVGKHAIDSIGWFGSRKVAAVGFGSEPPEVATADRGAPPAGRGDPVHAADLIERVDGCGAVRAWVRVGIRAGRHPAAERWGDLVASLFIIKGADQGKRFELKARRRRARAATARTRSGSTTTRFRGAMPRSAASARRTGWSTSTRPTARTSTTSRSSTSPSGRATRSAWARRSSSSRTRRPRPARPDRPGRDARPGRAPTTGRRSSGASRSAKGRGSSKPPRPSASGSRTAWSTCP